MDAVDWVKLVFNVEVDLGSGALVILMDERLGGIGGNSSISIKSVDLDVIVVFRWVRQQNHAVRVAVISSRIRRNPHLLRKKAVTLPAIVEIAPTA